MAQNRASYAYNPDVPTRKWHQKWINPVISLQNTPPTSHGTPAPTKEDGEVGHAGFKIRAWIPMDEDEDVTEEKLQEEVDWWSKPGAPLRPELRPQVVAPVAPVVVVEEPSRQDDVMQIDPPNETATTPNLVSTDVPQVGESFAEAPAVVSPMIQSPKPPSPALVDTDMPDAQPSPSHLSTKQTSASPSAIQPSPQSAHIISSPTLTPQPTETLEVPKSPSKSDHSPAIYAATMADILDSSKYSPPSDPLAQAQEVAAGLAIETPGEHAEHDMDPGNRSGAGGGIAGEGIVGGGNEDLHDGEGVVDDGISKERTEEEMIIQETKRDLSTEIVKDSE